MRLTIPKRGELIAALPLFTQINPLARPRLNFYSKAIYQPKDNQQALLKDLSNFEPIEIAFPVIVDSFINFTKTGSLSFPVQKRYGDEDNLRKAISDGLQHAMILIDDRYVLGGENYKCFNKEDVCLIKIYAVEEKLGYVRLSA